LVSTEIGAHNAHRQAFRQSPLSRGRHTPANSTKGETVPRATQSTASTGSSPLHFEIIEQ